MELDFDYKRIADRATEVLRDAFPDATIETQEGWHGRVHITITAPAFNELTETQKQQLVWDVLRQDLGEDALGISFVLPYGVEHAA